MTAMVTRTYDSPVPSCASGGQLPTGYRLSTGHFDHDDSNRPDLGASWRCYGRCGRPALRLANGLWL